MKNISAMVNESAKNNIQHVLIVYYNHLFNISIIYLLFIFHYGSGIYYT